MIIKRNFMKCSWPQKKYFSLIIILIIIISSGAAQAQSNEYKRFLGEWVTGPTRESYLRIDNETSIQINLNIEDLDGMLYVQMKSPDADAFNMPAEEAVASGEKIKIYFEPMNVVFKGEINRANNLIIGNLAFLGKTYPLSFVKINHE